MLSTSLSLLSSSSSSSVNCWEDLWRWTTNEGFFYAHHLQLPLQIETYHTNLHNTEYLSPIHLYQYKLIIYRLSFLSFIIYQIYHPLYHLEFIINHLSADYLSFIIYQWSFIRFITWLRWKSPSSPLHLCQAKQKGSRCAPQHKKSNIFFFFSFQGEQKTASLFYLSPTHQLINCRDPNVQLPEIVRMLHPAKYTFWWESSFVGIFFALHIIYNI